MTTHPAPTRSRLPFWACVPLACVLMFAPYLGAAPVALIEPFLPKDPSQEVSSAVNILVSCLILAAAVLIFGWVSRRTLGRRLAEIGLRGSRDAWWLFGLGWLLSSVALVGSQLLVGGLGLPHRPLEDVEGAGLAGSALVMVLLMKVFQAIAMQGIPEEVLWRGWLMHCLAGRPRTALAVSALTFGAMHWISKGGQQGPGEQFVYCLQAVGFAFLAGALALRLKSLWCAIGVHAGLHLTNLALGFTPLLYDGPVVWALQAALYTALGLALLAGWKGSRVEYTR